MIKVEDKRIQAIIDRALAKPVYSSLVHKLDPAKYSEALVKETVQECMKQLAMAVNINDYDTSILVSTMWNHLAMRYGIAEDNID